MGAIVFGPNWFFGIDSIFEVVSAIVALLIAWFSYKSYKVMKDSKFKSMATSFALIASGLIVKIVTNLSIYAGVKGMNPIEHVELIYEIGYFLARYLYILGLLILLIVIVLKIVDRRNIMLFALMSLVLIWLSYYSYYVYHGLAATVLVLIVQHFYNNCNAHKTTTARCVFVSFASLLVAHLTFMAVELYRPAYVLAEGIQLFGFLNLAANFLLIMKRR